MSREKIFKVVCKIAKFIFNTWTNKVGNIIKLNALWGVIIIFIGGLVKLDGLIALGIGMCCAFVLLLLCTYILFAFIIIIDLIWKLLAYTEKVFCGKNRIFE